MFISVIVPVYNVEKYLNKCMTSLLNQHYTDMEIIIVDDKSTDSSLSIAKGYKKYKNIKVISKEKNSGLSDSRNIGIREASGKYIMFLDSDDYVEDDCFFKIQEIVKEEHEPDIVYFGYYEEYEDTNIKNVKYGYVSSRNHAYTGEEFAFAELRKRNLYAAACFGIYKRELLMKNKLFFESGILHEDELWTPQVILNADKVYTSDYVFYHYLRRKGSITRSGDKTKHGKDMLYICKKLDKVSKTIKVSRLKKYMDNHIAMLYMKGMTEGKLYQKQVEIDRFYPLRKACFAKDRVKAILFALNLKIYYKINTMSKQGTKHEDQIQN